MPTGKRTGSLWCWLVIFGATVLVPMMVHGQPTPIGADKTILEIELLTPRVGGSLLAPQQWGQAFDRLGYAVQIRSPLEGDKPSVTEQSRGTLRFVKVVGVLDRDGKLFCGDQIYSLSDTGRLRAWLDSIRVYGAQGSPDGQPLWGLSREQFDKVFGQMAAVVAEFKMTSQLQTDMAQIPVPSELPIRFHSTLDPVTVNERLAAGNFNVQGLTSGTALAAVLGSRGLAYRPLRKPDGSIELVVQEFAEVEDPWPIGWDVPRDRRPVDAAPSLLRLEPFIGLDPQPLDSALETIRRSVPIPLLIDHRRCAAAGIDLKRPIVQYSYRRCAWAEILRVTLQRNQLVYALRNDERGQVFVYVQPFERVAVPRESLSREPM